jgi:hypothetical protein
MNDYALYLESGPKHRKTMVHVLDLLGCIANGPTTEAAIEATPAAIESFRRFCARHGEDLDAEAPFTTCVVEHVTEGDWLGNGSPYATFTPDLAPVSDAEVVLLLQRFHWLREELAAWAEAQADEALDAKPAEGRTARAILLHVMNVGGHLSTALGGVTGFSRVCAATERGQISLAEGLREVEAIASARVLSATPAERAAVIQRPKEIRTLRKALRRMLEHSWEHLAELSRRPGGPAV